jgi:hypothetical protein
MRGGYDYDIFSAIGAPAAKGADLAVARRGTGNGYGGDRKRPVDGGVVCGSRRARRGCRPGRARAKLPPGDRAFRVNLSRLRRATFAALLFLSCSRPSFAAHAQAVRPGAPKVRP